MSQQARQNLVKSPNTIFQSDSQRIDLLTIGKTQTQLIALLLELVGKGHILEFTAIKSDHRDDSDLGLHCHFFGYCADLWPLASRNPGDYLDAGDQRFKNFLHDVSVSPWLYQIGLAGSADTPTNQAWAGLTVFSDEGADHIHIGSNGP